MPESQNHKKTPDKKHGHRTRRALLTGVVALFPLALTIVVLRIIWAFILAPISEPLGRLIKKIVIQFTPLTQTQLPEWADWAGTIAALGIAFIAVYFLGLLLATFIGRRLLRVWDRLLTRLPLISSIYPHAKQVANFLFGERKQRFNRVVAIEYPRKGVYSLGFATSTGPEDIGRHTGEEMVAVFVPTSPTPFTGWTVMVPENEVIDVDMTVDEAVRFTVSCGVIVPGEQPTEGISSSDGFLNGD